MKENKLGTYLTSFTEDDWQAYQRHSKALYSENSDYQDVINYIKKHKSRYDPSYMDGEYLRKKVRPSANKQVFANVISNLCKFIEQYLTWAEVENDPMMKDTLLLQALGKRGLSDQFYKHKEKSKLKRDLLPTGLWNNYHDFMAEYLLYYCNMTSDIETSKVALQVAHKNCNQFYDVINGYLSVEMHNRTILLNENWIDIYSLSSIEKVNNSIKGVYNHLINLKEKKASSSFKFLKTELHKAELSNEIRYTILIHLTSYINGQMLRGYITDGTEILNLYHYGLEKNLLFPNGLIPLIRYINIIDVACSLKDFKWASEFVVNYSNQVGQSNQIEIELLGNSLIEFSKGKFEKVIDLLRGTKFKYFEVEARARWFLLSANFELNKENPDTTQYNILSFINFLKRHKLKTTKLTIISLIKSANYLNLITKSRNFESILVSIKNEKSLLYRKWLISKITEKIDINSRGTIN